MPLPTITMQLPAGSDVPSIVHLNDGTTIKPNSSGQITVNTKFMHVLMAAGWQIVVSGGTTHVP